MFKFSAAIISSIMLAMLVSGCTFIQELPPEKSAAAVDTPEKKMCRELLTAFLKNDGKAFVRLLPEETQEQFTVKNFENTRRSIVESVGEPISFGYVTKLELTALTPHIWKIRFKRTDRKTEQEFTSEVLFRIITGKLDGKVIITSFQFI